MAEAVELLPYKSKVLSLKPQPHQKKKSALRVFMYLMQLCLISQPFEVQ
jgi:hypothetical protein